MPRTASPDETAYRAGRKAYYMGETIDKCDNYPTSLIHDRAEWRRGYMDASEDDMRAIEARGGTI